MPPRPPSGERLGPGTTPNPGPLARKPIPNERVNMPLSKLTPFAVPALILAGCLSAHAAEEAKPSPPPVASGRPPLAGATAPGKAATQAVTDPMAVPPSERAPGAGTTMPASGTTSPGAHR